MGEFVVERNVQLVMTEQFDGGFRNQYSRPMNADQRERGRLGDLGYRILTIRYDSTIDEQLVANQDVFGIGTR